MIDLPEAVRQQLLTKIFDMVRSGVPLDVLAVQGIVNAKIAPQQIGWKWARQFLVGAGWRRVVNIDESGLLMAPSACRVWTFPGSNAEVGKFISLKQQCTLTCAISTTMDMPTQSQLTFAGTTARTLPHVALPEGVTTAFSASHWASATTLAVFITQVEEHHFAFDSHDWLAGSLVTVGVGGWLDG